MSRLRLFLLLLASCGFALIAGTLAGVSESGRGSDNPLPYTPIPEVDPAIPALVLCGVAVARRPSAQASRLTTWALPRRRSLLRIHRCFAPRERLHCAIAFARRNCRRLIPSGEPLMTLRNLIHAAVSFLAMTAAQGANPFLNAPDDKPVTAKFRGAEWGDNIAQEEIGLSAHVVTTRVAKMSWGEIYKIAFTDIASRANERRKIAPEYFIVTDDRIMLLNEENMDAAIKKIAATEKPPEFEQRDIYGITEGKFDYTDGPWETTIELKDDLCIYEANHNSSGHFKKIVWKKNVGLMEYAMGYGAMADGFRLKRVKS